MRSGRNSLLRLRSNTVLHTTTINFTAPLKGHYEAATAQINGNGVVAGHGERHDQAATGTGLPNQQVALDFAPLTYVQTAGGAGPEFVGGEGAWDAVD